MSITVRKRIALPVVVALLAVTAMIVAQSALAGHIRPRSATPTSVALAVAYDECTPGLVNSTHNPIFLPGGSCIGGSLARTSPFITHGDPATGQPAQFQGRLHQVVSLAAPVGYCAGGAGGCKTVLFVPTGPNVDFTGPPPGVTASFSTDVRCGPSDPPGHPACSAVGAANPTGPPDYTGFLSANSSLRITDHNNETAPGSGVFTSPGTVSQLLFTVPVVCSVTVGGGAGGVGIGAFCTSAATDAHALCGCIRQTAGGLANIEEGQIVVTDGNIDANPFVTTDGPNRDAARMGIFIP